MFGIDLTAIAFVGLVALAAGALIFFFMFDRVSNEVRTEARVKTISSRDVETRATAGNRVAEAARRKKNVQDSLKQIESVQKSQNKNKITLKRQLLQAGLKTTVQQFYIMSAVCGIVFAVAALFFGLSLPFVGAALIIGGLGFPRFMLSRIRNRRFNKFLAEFPNAVDVIVRGVRAGLPINDCLGIIAREAKEPVAGEFRRVIEAQQVGLPLPEAVTKLYESMPLPESNFFAIVLAIQSQAGGNLSEALGNLSNVLRDRKKMKGKIQAMSAEAKASGMIIGALPLVVMGLVYVTTPDYIKILFVTTNGNIVLLCSALWMTIGILVMKKMINFDF